MASVEQQISQLEAGIEAQEALRGTLGDAMVDAAVGSMRSKLDELRAEYGDPSEKLMERLQGFLPQALAEKMHAAGGGEGERKQVTVLSVEIAGLTAITDRLDAAEAESVSNAVLKELAEAVYREEGYVDKLAGDSVTAVFGAPVTHEDDADRALRAALALRESFERFNREWYSRLGEPLSLHMGVNSGPVDAGKLGDDLRMPYTVVGDTVTSAARLQDAAEPGQILFSPSVHRLAGAAFTFVALEPIRIKGQREPLRVYELGHARTVPGKPRGLHELATAFVGRDAEMAQLRQVIADLEAGTGGVVAIHGEAGIGKSRLMAEWHQEVKEGERVTWMEGRCLAHFTGYPYGPFLGLLRSYAKITDNLSEEAARFRLDQAVDRLFPDVEEAKAQFASLLAFRLSPEEKKLLKKIPGEQRRERIFDLTYQFFAQLAEQGPILLVIEDMHWADATSLELIEYLLPLVSEAPLALVSISRPVSQCAPLKVAARNEERFTHISLERLPETGSVELVCRLLSIEECPTSLRRLILEKAEGNPFFVEELIRTLIECGALARNEDEVWQTTPLIETIDVPGSLEALLMARLDRLPAETKALAQKAAVIGRVFLLKLLRQLAEVDGDIDADVSELERDVLIEEHARDPEVEYMFHHALTQEVAYKSLLPARLKDLHRRVALAMERLFADRLAEFASFIADHFHAAECWELAFKYHMLAGDLHADLYANAEARERYAKAEEAHKGWVAEDTDQNRPLSEEKLRQCVNLHLKICEVSWFSESPEDNLERLKEAETLAKDLKDAAQESDVDERIWEANLDHAGTQHALGQVHLMRAAHSEAIECFERVLRVAKPLNDPSFSKEIRQRARTLLALPSHWKGNALLLRDQLPEAETLIREGIPALEEAGKWREWVFGSALHGEIVTFMGDPSTGIPEVESAVNESRKKKALTEGALCGCVLTVTYLAADELPSALECARRTVKIAELANDPVTVSVATGWLSWAESRMEDYEAASKTMARSRQMANELGSEVIMHNDWLLAVRAQIALGLGRLEEVIELAQGAAEIPSVFALGLIQRAWGQALDALDATPSEDAETHLMESVTMLKNAEYRLEAARSRVALAEHHSTRNPTAARTELEKALEQWEDSGLIREAERTRKLLDGLST